MEKRTVAEIRRKLDELFTSCINQILNLAEEEKSVEQKEELSKKLREYKAELASFTKAMKENKELRYGNLLNALNEAEALVSEEGKGVIDILERQLNEETKEIQKTITEAREKQNLLIKFLETEGKVEL
ncbi:hypothetical protein HZB00_02855 [Candidatus Woesearchaeota archaeon]|nr:hypothetical protein [Candidatus Woesearchaeota archaeon]